ncbi:MAG TPA: hypothetical protein VM290_11340 [Gaiellaceae bacterium]|nr:hypothetical protein [Gaiellaceae bacterium]
MAAPEDVSKSGRELADGGIDGKGVAVADAFEKRRNVAGGTCDHREVAGERFLDDVWRAFA